ncbi:MAG: transcriptional regulator [Elusimicrobia bacterium RIFOXYD2_FULL_34_15]|nr:MAG: transcriptional regulator [Elusimicrobia bacterium RIFOXYD2_FULL_34_15]
MSELNLITCIVQRGKADKVVKEAIDAGAEGATIFYARGTGIRQKLGFWGKIITPEKEVILIVTKEKETNAVFDAIVKSGKLDKPGQGFAFVHAIDRAVGFLEQK